MLTWRCSSLSLVSPMRGGIPAHEYLLAGLALVVGAGVIWHLETKPPHTCLPIVLKEALTLATGDRPSVYHPGCGLPLC
jgi:hypothetical protein